MFGVMVSRKPREGDELTHMAQETFDRCVRAVTSGRHSVRIRCAVRERHGKALCDCGAGAQC